jgi:hypothetical protein
MHNFSGRDCRDSGLTAANNERTGKMTPREIYADILDSLGVTVQQGIA